MKHTISKYLVVLLVMIFVCVNGATAIQAQNIVVNGSFEEGGNIFGSGFQQVSAGSDYISNWTINSGSIDYIGSYWQPSDGSRSLDMSGDINGSITQVIPTTPGNAYVVTFDMAGNPILGPSIKTLTVDVGGTPTEYIFNTHLEEPNQTSLSTMGWTPQAYTFTATSGSTTLRFASTTISSFGPALDNVVVKQLLPSTPDECKKNGWQSFAEFKNQGDCVSFVTTGGSNPPAN